MRDAKASSESAGHTDTQRHASEEDALCFAVAVARLADSLKTEQIQVLDLRGLSALAHFFVIGTGTSDRQMRAVLDAVEEYARGVGRRPFSTTHRASTTWVLADYVDVVIHLFDEEHRDYYDLDGLWGDAPCVEWRPDTPVQA